MAKYTQEEIDSITNNISLLDYFLHLEHRGKVKFDSKKGRDFFFRTENDKFSVNENGFFSFNSNEGGKILKAVMTLENKSWKEALDFLSGFSNHYKNEFIAERKNEFKSKENNNYSQIKIQYSGAPNNEKLLAYFQQRGISKEILQQYTRQIHYENNGKKYFGIGLENLSGGFEIRNPLAKIKIGKTDISEIKGTKNEMIVFEGMSDMLSFLQLQKQNSNSNNRTLVSLNSITNVDRFMAIHKDFAGKLFLCLDGDKAGDLATKKILQGFSENNVKDIRPFYSISETQNKDLNDYLKNKLNLQKENTNINQQKLSGNENNTAQSRTISETQQVEPKTPESDVGESFQESQSQQNRNNGAGQEVGSNNAGDGPAERKRSHLGRSEPGRESTDGPQQNDDGKSEEKQYSLGGRLLENSTNIPELDALLLKYKGQNKITNEQVAEVVSAACFVSEDKKIILKENLAITEDLKDIANQYKSGGTSKEGRGILDEYYTDSKIVDTIRNLISNNFKSSKTLNVLEPSVGTGNFVHAVKSLNTKTYVTGFEINETTAKIAKLFHPDADISLRSFETEFVDEKGVKTKAQDYRDKYDLIIGNPPYGEHRGFYKGLGEEPKISKYEDYFVKRSLDVLKDGGTLAMVLPSPWLNRQKKMQNAEIVNAFRLPSGSFAGTQIGTDIIILKKSQQKISQDISDYFIKNPEKVLGEIHEKNNRFGRPEQYVKGNLDDALEMIKEIQKKRETERIGDLFDGLWNANTQDEIAVKSDTAEKEKFEKLKNEKTIDLDEIKDKIEQVLEVLDKVKFKSPAVQKEIDKYTKLDSQINNEFQKFDTKALLEIHKKADKILRSQNERDQEYKIQTKPDIKSKVLKYQFSKNDEIVNASIQNSSDISEKEINAFRDTNYDGTLNNYGKHFEYANYIEGKWIHDFYYTEGNIYAKLKKLKIDFADKHSVGGTENQYEKQKALLEKVLPKPKNLDEIIISPNHEFVHKFDLGKIEKDQYNYISNRYEKVTLDYNLAEKFKDFVSTLPYDAFQGSSSWEVKGFVDNDTVTGSDKERNALIRERRKVAANDLFGKFVREELPEELRDRFVKEFNENYNNIHVPDYSRFPLFSRIYQNFKGEELILTEVQKAGIGRQTTKGVGLLAHEVGFGKTLSGILSMHEAMERGNAKRPLIAVPNESILKQWVETIFETIPNARVNVLGNLGKDYDLSKFDNKDGEITLVTYEGFNNIGFSKEVTENLASKFNYISANELKSVTNTERDIQIELQKEKEIEGKMKCGKIYDWEDFGFDHLTFDEVHNANHIVGKVKIEDRRFASDFRNQNQQTSKLGINTWMAAQYIQDKHDGRNITLLSATPFTNKPLEYYSILSLIANKRLEEKGYFNVNNFFETFMEADNDMEIDAKGDVKFKANVRRFKNNTLFQQLLSEFIDIKGEEDNPELIRPNKINKEYKIEQNDLTKEQYELLNQSFNENEKGAILTHILNARLIAISPYLSPFYDGEEPSVKEFVENSPKLIEMMRLIRQNKMDIQDSGQIIYSELAVDQFPKLKEYLIKEIGFKPDEVGIITGKTTKPQRISIQENFNSGKIKVIIGSEAIQEGMNLQEKTTDTYLLSLPYNFTSLRQVEGRSWRQGNENENIRMNFMLTNDSIDVFMLQKLQSKQARYLEAMKKGADVLDISDISTQELKTSIITNPETRANIEIELMKKRIEGEKSKLVADSAFVMRKFEEFVKIKDSISTAENTYNKIVGYAKDKSGDYEYWEKQLPYYMKNIDNARVEVQKEIEKLAEKGVNIAEIEKQTKITEDKISALDAQLENLPEARAELVELYRLEKEEMLKKNADQDPVKERAQENSQLFKQQEPMLTQLNSIREENYEYQGRKR
ncbi:toprim domain-containing protein [Epilithonimonas caeni]|uniref:toprim domain-containing protein n=1 Tax=Epilithonimonas caeni TaxID=365343 RepID=UPI0004188555|nr:toprim domain-containing protein [Epilithonimonas caeni]